MSVRVLTADDAGAFIALRLEGVELFPAAFLLTRAEAESANPDGVRRWLETGQAYGLSDGDQLVGFCSLARQPWATARHRATVGPFYVTPSFQGAGGAQKLMECVVSDSRAMGIKQLELWVWSGNPRAIAFYHRNGFQQMGILPRAVIAEGEGRDDFFLVRHLDR